MVLIILGIIAVLFVVFLLYTTKYNNPYKLYLLMGKKGVGKSTILQQIAYRYYKRGWNIYCNNGDTKLRAAYQVDASRLWEVDFKPRSVVLIDEVNLLWDNRDFKSFPQELNAFFRVQRHKKLIIYMFSQTADVDKKIRDLTDRVYLVKRYFNVLICGVPYSKDIEYRPPNKEGMQSGFMDVFNKVSFGPFGCLWCWLPRWIRVNDSYRYADVDAADLIKKNK